MGRQFNIRLNPSSPVYRTRPPPPVQADPILNSNHRLTPPVHADPTLAATRRLSPPVYAVPTLAATRRLPTPPLSPGALPRSPLPLSTGALHRSLPPLSPGALPGSPPPLLPGALLGPPPPLSPGALPGPPPPLSPGVLPRSPPRLTLRPLTRDHMLPRPASPAARRSSIRHIIHPVNTLPPAPSLMAAHHLGDDRNRNALNTRNNTAVATADTTHTSALPDDEGYDGSDPTAPSPIKRARLANDFVRTHYLSHLAPLRDLSANRSPFHPNNNNINNIFYNAPASVSISALSLSLPLPNQFLTPPSIPPTPLAAPALPHTHHPPHDSTARFLPTLQPRYPNPALPGALPSSSQPLRSQSPPTVIKRITFIQAQHITDRANIRYPARQNRDKKNCNSLRRLSSADITAVSSLQVSVMENLRGVPSGLDASANGDISAGVREVVVDWIAEIAGKFKTRVHTFALAVYYFDRLTVLKCVTRDNAQLVAGVGLMLACKMEEEVQPRIVDIAFVCGDVSAEAVAVMELDIMKALNYNLGVQTAATVVQWVCARRASIALGLGRQEAERDERVQRVVQLGNFAMIIGLLDAKVSCMNGAAVAIGAACVAMEVEGLQDGPGSEWEDGDWGWSEAAVGILESWNRFSARYADTGKTVMNVWKTERIHFEARRPELLDLIWVLDKNEESDYGGDSDTGVDIYMDAEDDHEDDHGDGNSTEVQTEVKTEIKMEEDGSVEAIEPLTGRKRRRDEDDAV